VDFVNCYQTHSYGGRKRFPSISGVKRHEGSGLAGESAYRAATLGARSATGRRRSWRRIRMKKRLSCVACAAL
jgi:hypothetical protein